MCRASVYKNENGEYNCFLLSDINVNAAQIKFELDHQNLVHIQGNTWLDIYWKHAKGADSY